MQRLKTEHCRVPIALLVRCLQLWLASHLVLVRRIRRGTVRWRGCQRRFGDFDKSGLLVAGDFTWSPCVGCGAWRVLEHHDSRLLADRASFIGVLGWLRASPGAP